MFEWRKLYDDNKLYIDYNKVVDICNVLKREGRVDYNYLTHTLYGGKEIFNIYYIYDNDFDNWSVTYEIESMRDGFISLTFDNYSDILTYFNDICVVI